jgi:hypothetical protein
MSSSAPHLSRYLENKGKVNNLILKNYVANSNLSLKTTVLSHVLGIVSSFFFILTAAINRYICIMYIFVCYEVLNKLGVKPV